MNWLKGKKTYIAAGILAALGVALVVYGNSEIGMYCILTAAGFVGLGDRANRHQAEILAAIGGIVKAAEGAKTPRSMSVGDAVKVIGDALAKKKAAEQPEGANGNGH